MLLAIDTGNTNTVFAVFDGDSIRGQWRMSTEDDRTADEYGVWLLQVMARAGISEKDISHAVVASVVPSTLFALRTLCRQYFQCELLVVSAPGVKVDMKVKIDRPAELGADRLVNAVAAWKKYKSACIIIDFGTATTFDVVNDAGEHCGGVIAPGVNLSLQALHTAAAKLPVVAIQPPEKVIGTGTVSAMQSGIYYGYVGMVEGIVTRIKQEYGKPMKVIATGGLASLYAKATKVIEHNDPDLTIYGLYEIFRQNT